MTATHHCGCGHIWIGLASAPDTCLACLVGNERQALGQIMQDLNVELLDLMDPRHATIRQYWRQAVGGNTAS